MWSFHIAVFLCQELHAWVKITAGLPSYLTVLNVTEFKQECFLKDHFHFDIVINKYSHVCCSLIIYYLTLLLYRT